MGLEKARQSHISLTGVITPLRSFLLPPMQAAREGQEFGWSWVEDGGWR